MEEHGQNRYSPRFDGVTLREFLVRLIISVVGISLLSISPVADDLETHLSRKLNYYVRRWLQAEPQLDPRIKIFAYDDPTVSMLGQNEMSSDDWVKVLEALAYKKPKVIVIDKLFDSTMIKNDASHLAERIRSLSVPIVGGAFSSPKEIPLRAEIKLEKPIYNLGDLYERGHSEVAVRDRGFWFNVFNETAWLEIVSGFAYGPPADLADAFFSLGHIVYKGDGYIFPFLRLNNTHGLPHISFAVADQLFLKDQHLNANGNKVPVDSMNRVHVNFVGENTFRDRSYSMRPLITRARRATEISIVDEGDVVILLPSMYTGSTDWTAMPLGLIPGGYVVTSMVNSVLSGQWLTPIESFVWLPIIVCAFGAILGLCLPGMHFWLAMGLAQVTMVAMGTLLFSYAGLVVPWLFSMVGALTAGALLHSCRIRHFRTESLRIEKELETARLVQRAFFPKDGRYTKEIDIASWYRPASECSGDWWGYYQHSRSLQYIIVGDAAGHGMPAALLTGIAYSVCMTILKSHHKAKTFAKPSEILATLNNMLHQSIGYDAFMTLIVAAYDLERGVLTYANAGHCFPLLIPADPNDSRIHTKTGRLRNLSSLSPLALASAGSVLGMSEHMSYKDLEIELRLGDKFLFFTDGLVDCTNPLGKSWGNKELMKSLLSCSERSSSGIRDHMVAESQKYRGSAVQKDDITIVVAEVKELLKSA